MDVVAEVEIVLERFHLFFLEEEEKEERFEDRCNVEAAVGFSKEEAIEEANEEASW